MSKKFKSDFIGTGSMKEFVEESNGVFEAINNPVVIMPVNYAGAPVTLEVTGDNRLTLDMGDALIFSLGNVVWNLTNSGSATFNSYSVTVTNGQLHISVDAS